MNRNIQFVTDECDHFTQTSKNTNTDGSARKKNKNMGGVTIYQDSKILLFKDVQQLFKISKIPKFDLTRCTKIPTTIF